jgi:hypothetical protein
LLDGLLRDADGERVALGWLLDRLGDPSFGLVMLLLALLAAMPGASAIVAPLLAILALQMILGHTGPAVPRRVAQRSVRTQRLARTLGRAVPVLRAIEGFIHPRCPTPFGSAGNCRAAPRRARPCDRASSDRRPPAVP